MSCPVSPQLHSLGHHPLLYLLTVQVSLLLHILMAGPVRSFLSLILKRFLNIYGSLPKNSTSDKTKAATEASKQTAEELKEAWKLHFGIYMVYGKDTFKDVEENEKL